MSTLIPNITISEFNKLKVHQKKRLKSCEVYSDGELLFTFVKPVNDYIRVQAEYLSQKANTIDGETIEEILNESDIPVPV